MICEKRIFISFTRIFKVATLPTIALHPAPHGCVIGFETTFREQLFDIAQRKRVTKIPADGAKNQLRVGLPPFEDCWPGRHLEYFKLPAR
jgi:hypothetical protein